MGDTEKDLVYLLMSLAYVLPGVSVLPVCHKCSCISINKCEERIVIIVFMFQNNFSISHAVLLFFSTGSPIEFSTSSNFSYLCYLEQLHLCLQS